MKKQKYNNSQCVSEPTWREIMEFIQNKISEEHWDKKATIVIDDSDNSVALTSIETLPEDIWAQKEEIPSGVNVDETCSDLQTIKDGVRDFDIDNYEIVTPKGLPFFYFNSEDSHE